MPSPFTHLDAHGQARMVDVGEKPVTKRSATASGQVGMMPETLQAILGGGTTKGNVLEVARLAGIMAAKRCDELIPLCHTLPLDAVSVDFQAIDDRTLGISATASITGRTGVEMEALLAVSVSALTIYDMCKSRDRSMVIGHIQLEAKSGGRSGEFARSSSNPPNAE